MLLGLAFLLAGCQRAGPDASDPGEAEEGEDETPAIPVEVAGVDRGDVYATYTGTAPLEAFGEAEVIAKVGGEVRELLVEEGDVVRAGDVLARLDGDRLRLELKQSEANLRKLERDYKRNIELHEKGLVSPGAFENIKYDLDALKAAYELARLQLSYTEIRAPIDGVISERYIKVGNTIAANEPTYHLSDLDPLIAYLHVPEREYKKLAAGQIAGIQVDALGKQIFSGLVSRVSPVVDPDTGTFKVTIEINDEEGRLKPGMFGRINIVHDKHVGALQVPRSAIVEDADEMIVFVVEDTSAHRRVVRTGYGSAGQIEILEGLDGSEQIVVVGQSGLRDGAKVEIVTASGAQTSGTPAM